MSTKVIVGYDGSLVAAAAIGVAARLLPDAHAHIAYMSTPPFAQSRLARRLRAVADGVNELIELTEHEGTQEALHLAAMGVALARAAGWNAEAVVQRSYSGPGRCLAELADRHNSHLIVVGRRGVNGVEAMLGSASQVLLNSTSRPVLVVPHPLLSKEFDAVSDGPVVVGVDGSREAAAAWHAVEHLMPHRQIVPVFVMGEVRQSSGETAVLGGRTVVAVGTVRRRNTGERAVAQTLTAYAERHNAALLVVGTRDRTSTQRLLRGSVAGDVMHLSHRPVVIVPHKLSGQEVHS